MNVECFAQRLLNPFRGAMHTIRFESAEAVTLDGVHWDIYVANDQLLEGLPVNNSHTQISDIRYGSWCANKGLKRGPIYPSEDFRRLEEMGHVVFDYLTIFHDKVPFPFRDRYELWLLDTSDRPLALLHSVVDEKTVDLGLEPQWRTGFTAAEQFASPVMGLLGQGQAAAPYLTGYINGLAGAEPAAQWFRREKDGSGTGLEGLGARPSTVGRKLAAEDFPSLMLGGEEHDPLHRQLIDHFHAWQAPWLLTLPDLDLERRQALEIQATEQAAALLQHYRLYPATADVRTLRAALVQAVMLQAEAATTGRRDDAVSTFYIELNTPSSDWERGK